MPVFNTAVFNFVESAKFVSLEKRPYMLTMHVRTCVHDKSSSYNIQSTPDTTNSH